GAFVHGCDLVDDGEAEPEGLAGPGGGPPDDVGAAQTDRDGVLLDGEGPFDAERRERLHGLLADSELGEGRPVVLRPVVVHFVHSVTSWRRTVSRDPGNSAPHSFSSTRRRRPPDPVNRRFTYAPDAHGVDASGTALSGKSRMRAAVASLHLTRLRRLRLDAPFASAPRSGRFHRECGQEARVAPR